LEFPNCLAIIIINYTPDITAIEDQFRGTEVSVPTPCQDGELPPEPSPSTPSPSSLTLPTPMIRREYFSPEAAGSTDSYVFISLSHGVIFM
jgi:hypothetical protein